MAASRPAASVLMSLVLRQDEKVADMPILTKVACIVVWRTYTLTLATVLMVS